MNLPEIKRRIEEHSRRWSEGEDLLGRNRPWPQRRIEIVRDDIAKQAVDAIVNAANTSLIPGGGVDGAITRAAGPAALTDRERIIVERGTPPLLTGEAVVGAAGDLSARWIVYTAGPIYSGKDRDRRQLRDSHVASLRAAGEAGARSIAFPAISCGIYGYPAEEAAPIALSAVMHENLGPDEVRFVLYDETLEAIFIHALSIEVMRHQWGIDEMGRWFSPGY
ncbi:MAG: macro domain-containing protein [Actinomycetota bacterium]